MRVLKECRFDPVHLFVGAPAWSAAASTLYDAEAASNHHYVSTPKS